MSRIKIVAIFVFMFSLLILSDTLLNVSAQDLTTSIFVPLIADGEGTNGTADELLIQNLRHLDVSDANVELDEIDSYFTVCLLYGPTKQFYHFTDQQSVIDINFSSSNIRFTPTISINLFADDESTEQIEKWINNQHSDGLYADAPEPVYTKVLDETEYVVAEVNYVERVVGSFGQEYADYQVTYSVNDLTVPDYFQLIGFEQTAEVHILTKDCFVDQAPTGTRLLNVDDDDTRTFAIDRYFSPCLYGPTQQFFDFREQNTVMVVRFKTDDPSFEPTITVNLFAPELSEAEIGKWINNQHSDAIYGDAPQPVYKATLNAAAYSTIDTELFEQTVGRFGEEYDSYRVEYSVQNVEESGHFWLEGFESETVVHINTIGCS